MIPAAFDYAAPTSLRDALSILREHRGDARPLAGGQSLVPMMKLRLVNPEMVVDLRRIGDLAFVREQDGGLAIGPMTTYRTLETSALVQRRFPLLAEAASQVADLQVRNKGTIGGAIAHADPAADLPAVLVAAEARVRVAGGGRARSIPADRFFVDAFTTALGETELITEVRVPSLPPGTHGSYQKLANRASHFAIVGVAALVTLGAGGACERVRIGITGAGPTASRATAAERALQGKSPTPQNIEAAARLAGRGIAFIDDLHGSPAYRAHLTQRLTARALAAAAERGTR